MVCDCNRPHSFSHISKREKEHNQHYKPENFLICKVSGLLRGVEEQSKLQMLMGPCRTRSDENMEQIVAKIELLDGRLAADWPSSTQCSLSSSNKTTSKVC